MIEGLSVLGLITARGGSLGLPQKNLRTVGGKTLLARAVEAGRASRTIDRLILSSDDPEIIRVALMSGCEVPFVRPSELATSDARSIDVVHHALHAVPERYDLMVLLQPTSPLRTAEDIDAAVALCITADAPACVSVCEPDKSPFWCYTLDAADRLAPLHPELNGRHQRQQLPVSFTVNGAVYVARCNWIGAHESFLGPETVGYVMPRERSVDVDSELDLVVVEALLARQATGGTPATARLQASA